MAFDKIQDFSDSKTGVDAWGWYDDRDLILGSDRGDKLSGAEGDDEIHGNGGNDLIVDMTQNIFGPLPILLDLAEDERDPLTIFLDAESFGRRYETSELYSSGGNDRFFGDAGDDDIMGAGGNDFLDGGADNDRVWGGSGDDTVIGGSGDDQLYGNSGSDRMLGGSGDDMMHGGTGADFLQGGLGADYIDGGDLASNTFDSAVALGLMTRAQADAALRAANAGDTANYESSIFAVNVDLERATQTGGDAQGDVLVGIENLEGSRGSDTLRGDNNANILFGNLGNDTLEGRGGADSIEGGIGTDTASYASSFRGVDIDLLRTTQRGGDAQGDTLSSIENVVGTRLADSIRGDDAASGNRLEGGGGNDTLDGRGGNDTLDGGLGNDVLIGGDGIDTASFGSWDSTAVQTTFVQFNPLVTIRLGQFGTDGSATRSDFDPSTGRYAVAETDTLGADIENASGTRFGDQFFGNERDNEFFGRDGNDSFRADAGRDTYHGDRGIDTVDYSGSSAISGVVVTIDTGVRGSGGFASGDLLFSIENVTGSNGNDTIIGNSANNRLSGGRGDDNLSGGDGDDTLIGGAQTDIDRLSGGAGRDTFLYLDRDDSRTVAGRSGDAIQDFNTTDDRIDLQLLGIDAGDIRIENATDANGVNFSRITEDLNGNGTADVGEFSINVRVDGTDFVTMADLLV